MRLSDRTVHFIFYSILYHLISEALISVGFAFVRHDSAIQASLAALAAPSVGKVDDTAIGEAVFLDVVLHDTVVLMGIDTNVCIMRETEVHDIAKDAMNIWITGYTMNDMIGQGIVCPLTIGYL